MAEETNELVGFVRTKNRATALVESRANPRLIYFPTDSPTIIRNGDEVGVSASDRAAWNTLAAYFTDAEGNLTAPDFADTFFQALALKADKSDTYTKNEVDALVAQGEGSGGGPVVVGGVTSVNGQTGDVTIFVPTKTSDLSNDSHFLTQHQDISGKVDKESGKGLSTNDFTTALKQKLEGLSNYDDTAVRGLISSLQSALDTLTGQEDTTVAIDTMNEIIAFLDNYKNTDNLAAVLSTLESTIHTWVENKGYLTQHQSLAGKQDVITDLASIRTNATNGATAYGWGDHSQAGYLKQHQSLAGKQDVISDLATIRSNAANGQTAYGWGNHATQGYLKEHQSLTPLETRIQALENSYAALATVYSGSADPASSLGQNGDIYIKL